MSARQSSTRCPAVLGTLLLASAFPGWCAFSLAYADFGAGGSACCLAADSTGNTYVVGSVVTEFGTNIKVIRLDSSGQASSSFQFGLGLTDQPRAAALDPQGNLIVVGQTNSPDFPLVSPLISKTASKAGFVTKVNPASGQILFSTRIGGAAGGGSAANAITVDAAGNLFVAGQTLDPGFPVSAGALPITVAGGGTYGFVMEWSNAGDRIIYSTLLGGLMAPCSGGGSGCVGATTVANAIAVDASGRATVGGSTNALDFPVTAGVVQNVCRCQGYATNAFVAQLQANGGGLVFATYLGGFPYANRFVMIGTNTIRAVSLDAAGDVLVAGATDESTFPTTAGGVQPAFGSTVSSSGTHPVDGFVARLNATGTSLVFSTYLGGSDDDQVFDARLDAAGNAWVTGYTVSGNFPGAAVPFTGSFLAELSPSGTSLLSSQPMPLGAAGQALRVGAVGGLTVLGPSGSLVQMTQGTLQGIAVAGVASSAAGGVKGTVAPGEFVSLYGVGLGPTPPVGAVLDANGRVATQLAGVQVLFDGIPAPLLYVGPNQVNALAPYEIYGRAATQVQVTNANGNSETFQLLVKAAQPVVFMNGGYALAGNPDGSVNGAQNPAATGSVVTIYASGPGEFLSQPPDGSVVSGQSATAILPVSVLFNGLSVEVLYAGTPPGWVIGVLQVNLRLPPQLYGTFQLVVGPWVSNTFSLATYPGPG